MGDAFTDAAIDILARDQIVSYFEWAYFRSLPLHGPEVEAMCERAFQIIDSMRPKPESTKAALEHLHYLNREE